MPKLLTPREAQILAWIATGKSDWEIATILALSAKTINFHAQNAKKKLGTRSRVQAIVLALRDGLILFPPRGAEVLPQVRPADATKSGFPDSLQIDPPNPAPTPVNVPFGTPFNDASGGRPSPLVLPETYVPMQAVGPDPGTPVLTSPAPA